MPTHYSIKDRSFYANDTEAVLTLDQESTGPNLELIHATVPELRLTEEDQTDPAGRYRIKVEGDSIIIERAATASWATDTDLLTIASDGGLTFAGGLSIPDDKLLTFGGVAKLLYETADANANALILALPDGGATDVPVFAIGDQGILNKDLGFFNGITLPMVAVIDADEDSWIGLTYQADDVAAIKSNRSIALMPSGDTDDYLTIATVSNVPTIYGTGAYVRIGDAAATSNSLASEDDLMVSGKLEVDGALYADGSINAKGNIAFQTSALAIRAHPGLNSYLALEAYDLDDTSYREVGRLFASNQPYMSMGAGQEFKVTYDGLITSSKTVYINDTTNANMTLGLTINQGEADDEILALKSSDVAHGCTALSETDTFAQFIKSEAAAGGLKIRGLKDADGNAYAATVIQGYLAEDVDTTKSTAGRALVELYGAQISGGTYANVAANGNILAIRGYIGGGDITVAIIDEDGDLWVNGNIDAANLTLSQDIGF